MKKQSVFFLILLATFSSCIRHGGRNRTVEINNNGNHINIQYCGKVAFSDDETEIVNLSYNGYIKYKKNDRVVKINNDDGYISYKIIEEHNTVEPESAEGKKIIESAVKEIASYY